jgi:hypothetical protein
MDGRFDELGEKFEHHSFLLETLNKKIDEVASDLVSHREYTEAHGKVYRVKERGVYPQILRKRWKRKR